MSRQAKTSLAITLTLVATAFFAATVFLPVRVSGATLFVGGGGPGNYTTIQLAINAAAPGDTVFVYGGTYTEKITIGKTISLVGEDKNTTIIVGDGFDDTVHVNAASVNITGFTVTAGGAGIMLVSSPNSTIADNIIKGNAIYGIDIIDSKGSTIVDNTVKDNRYNIMIGSSAVNVVNNSFSSTAMSIANCGICIYAGFATVTGNTIVKNGIHMFGETLGSWNTHTIDAWNTVNGKPVYYWKNVTGGTIPPGAGQVILANSTGVLVTGQNINDTDSGISLGFSSHNNVTNNTAMGFFEFGGGIYLLHSDNNTIFGNNVSNGYYGARVVQSDGNAIADNLFWNNAEGIQITRYSTSNTLSNNTLSSGGYGIDIWKSNDTMVFENKISGNNCGVHLELGVGNRVFHNQLIANVLQAEDDSLNQWDDGYPSGGNYWSDYTGTDIYHGPNQDLPGADGIGDTPRPISGGANQDNYPLMNPFPPPPRAAPTAPLSLQAVAGNGQVTLSWSPPAWDGLSPVTNYAIYRGMTSGGETYLVTIGNVTTHLDGGLANGATYYYQVSAVNAAGEGPRSNEANATPATVPGRPRQLRATGGDANITLTWLPPGNNGGSPVTNYTIYRGTVSGGETFLVKLGDVLTYLDTGLANGVTYYYLAAASNVMGQGPNSTEDSATPLAPPSEPQNIQATHGVGQITLAWSAPTSDGGSPITNYRIYRGASSGSEIFLVQIGNVLSHIDPGLTNGQKYYYQVSAVNAVGEGPKSIEASATPGATPSSPIGLSATGGNAQIRLAWSPPVDNGGNPITGYSIYRGLVSGAEVYLTTIGNVTTFIDAPLTNGVTCFYKVAAVTLVGEGDLSTEAYATPMTVPGPPVGVVAMSTYFTAMVEWLAPVDMGGSPVTNYSVYRGTSPGGESLLVTLGNILSYTDANVTNGQLYYYVVSATNAAGEGPRSMEVRVTVPDHPSAPLNLLAAGWTLEIDLTWDPPASDGGCTITNYSIYRGFWSGGETLLTTIGVSRTYADTGLTNGVTYYYRVSATNPVGEGPQSNEAMSVPSTLPSPPAIVSAVGIDSEVVLTIFPPTDTGGLPIITYKMYRGTSPGGEVFITDIGTPSKHFDAGLTNGVTYYYKLSAVNAIGESNLSEEASAMPRALPSQPLNPQATAGFGQVQLTWQAPAKDGGYAITEYKVYRGTTHGGETLLANLGGVLSYTDSTVTNGQTYFYKVSATTVVGEGPQSDEASATPVSPPALPSPPRNLVAVAGNGQVALSWDAPAWDGGSPVTGYSLYRGTAAGGEVFIRTVGNILTYTDTGLTNGQTYYFQITASNVAGESGRSNEVSGRPAMEPGQPTGLVAVAGALQATLTWVAPASDGGSSIANYIIYRGAASNSETTLATVGNVLTYMDTDMVGGHAYYYKVSAINAIGEGPQSVEASVTISAPPNLPPTCSITAPPQGTEVSDRAAIQGVAADADGNIVVVEIRIDAGPWMGASGKNAWSYALNTKLYSNGQHTIEARSYDGKDFSQIASVTVSVNNPAKQGPGAAKGSSDVVGIALTIALLVVAMLLIFLFLMERRSKRPAAKLPESPVEKEPPAEEFEEEWQEEEEPPEESL